MIIIKHIFLFQNPLSNYLQPTTVNLDIHTNPVIPAVVAAVVVGPAVVVTPAVVAPAVVVGPAVVVVVTPAVVVMGAGVVPPPQMWIKPMLASSACLQLEKESRHEDLAVLTFHHNEIILHVINVRASPCQTRPWRCTSGAWSALPAPQRRRSRCRRQREPETKLRIRLSCPSNGGKVKAYWVCGRQKSETLCVLCLHSSEAGHAGVEGGGVDCGHGAAILHTRRAVVEGGDSVSSARVAEKGNHLSSKD